MPVLFGAKRYYDKHLTIATLANSQSNLANFYKIVQEQEVISKNKNRVHRNILNELPFIKMELLKMEKTTEGKLGSIKRFDKVIFGIQEFFLQVESSITNLILVFVLDILSIFSSIGETDVMTNKEEYQMSLKRSRKDECSCVDASLGVCIDEQLIQVDKVSYGWI